MEEYELFSGKNLRYVATTSTMSSRTWPDKETAAVSFNLQQRRVLENTMHNLSLEETRSLKLLEINHRVIKVNYRRLKDKVSRISSFLTADEIKVFSDMEANGNMAGIRRSPNLSSSLKIHSAEKCLKLNSSRPQTSASLAKDDEITRDNARFVSRSRSVAGFSTDFHSENDVTGKPFARPKTAFEASLGSHNDPPPRFSQVKLRPMTSVGEQTSAVHDLPTQGKFRDRAKTAPAGKLHTLFSCHEIPGNDVRTLNSVIGTASRPRSMSVSRASIDSNLGGDVHQERKIQMLKAEAQKSEALDTKKNRFLRTVTNYIESNKTKTAVAPTKASLTWQSVTPEVVISSERTLTPPPKRSRKSTREKFSRLSEAEYRKKVTESWRDVKKCRYLRVPGDKQDLTGYNTLVKDQLLLLDSLKMRRQISFPKGVQVNG